MTAPALSKTDQVQHQQDQVGPAAELYRTQPRNMYADIMALQRDAGNQAVNQALQPGGAGVPPMVAEVVQAPGQPLDPGTREFMEARFGQDFSQVRVHTDARAADSADAVNALAYTVGQHVVFGADQYFTDNDEARYLLGHELAHVVQQDANFPTEGAFAISQPNTQYEIQADQVAAQVQNVHDSSTLPISSMHTAPVSLQRALKPAAYTDVSSEPGKTRKERVSSDDEAQMAKDVDYIVAFLKEAWLEKSEQRAILSIAGKWKQRDANENTVSGTKTDFTYLDRFLNLLKARTFNVRRLKTLWWTEETLGALDEIWHRLGGDELKQWRQLVAASKAENATGPTFEEPESVFSYVGKREAIGGWIIVKGLGMALGGLADTALWAYWKTAPGMTLKMVLAHFNIKAEDFIVSEYLDNNFEEVAGLIAKAEGIDMNEELFAGVGLHTFSEASGKVLGNLMLAGGMGSLGSAAIGVGLAQAGQSVEQLHTKVQNLRQSNPQMSLTEILIRPDVLADLVGIVASAVGAKMSLRGVHFQSLRKLGLGLNVSQFALLEAAYSKVDTDATLDSPEKKQKAKADMLVQMITTGALAVDQKFGSSFNRPQGRSPGPAPEKGDAPQSKPEPTRPLAGTPGTGLRPRGSLSSLAHKTRVMVGGAAFGVEVALGRPAAQPGSSTSVGRPPATAPARPAPPMKVQTPVRPSASIPVEPAQSPVAKPVPPVAVPEPAPNSAPLAKPPTATSRTSAPIEPPVGNQELTGQTTPDKTINLGSAEAAQQASVNTVTSGPELDTAGEWRNMQPASDYGNISAGPISQEITPPIGQDTGTEFARQNELTPEIMEERASRAAPDRDRAVGSPGTARHGESESRAGGEAANPTGGPSENRYRLFNAAEVALGARWDFSPEHGGYVRAVDFDVPDRIGNFGTRPKSFIQDEMINASGVEQPAHEDLANANAERGHLLAQELSGGDPEVARALMTTLNMSPMAGRGPTGVNQGVYRQFEVAYKTLKQNSPNSIIHVRVEAILGNPPRFITGSNGRPVVMPDAFAITITATPPAGGPSQSVNFPIPN